MTLLPARILHRGLGGSLRGRPRGPRPGKRLTPSGPVLILQCFFNIYCKTDEHGPDTPAGAGEAPRAEGAGGGSPPRAAGGAPRAPRCAPGGGRPGGVGPAGGAGGTGAPRPVPPPPGARAAP